MKTGLNGFFFTFSILLVATGVFAEPEEFGSGERVAFVGDSITHAGGFVADLTLFHNLRHPGNDARVINSGISGGTLGQARRRFDYDIMQDRPDRVFVMMGMNDIRRDPFWKDVEPSERDARIRADALTAFRTNLTELIALFRNAGVKMVLMTPTPYDQYSEMSNRANLASCNDPGLSSCAEIVRRVAERENLPLIDLHRPLTALLRKGKSGEPYCPDRVHPGPVGNLIVAAEILKAMRVSPELSRVDIDAEKASRLPSGGVVFDYVPAALPFPKIPEYEETDACYPLTETINREIIVVRNLQKGTYALSFDGKEVGRFSAEDLAKGVNVALLDTPNQLQARALAEPLEEFRALVQLRRREQLVKNMLHEQGLAPEDEASANAYLDAWLEARKNARGYISFKAWIDTYRQVHADPVAFAGREERLRAKLGGVRPKKSCVSVVPVVKTAERRLNDAAWGLCRDSRNGAAYALSSVDAGSFDLAVDGTAACAAPPAIIVTDVNRSVWTHDKIALSVRSRTGLGVKVRILVSLGGGEKPVLKGSADTVVAGATWTDIVLGLDGDFALGDREIDLRQVKVKVNPIGFSAGTSGVVEVRDFRVCAPTETSTSAAFVEGDSVVVVPSLPRAEVSVRPDALKVFFALDNEDVTPARSRRKPGLVDAQQYAGFREMLLEGAEGCAVATKDLSSADVVVYASCRTNAALASCIADRVRNAGVPLYVTGEVLDSEVEALLPCLVGHGPLQDLPERRRLVPGQTAAAFVRAGGYSDAAFAVFRTVKAKDGATVHFAFDGGCDAVVEGTCGKGRVLYSAIGLGTSFVPGKAARDAFFLRALGHLSGRTFPERPYRNPRACVDGWYAGNDGFGHNGWTIGNGLLVENLSDRLEVSNGRVLYCLAAPRRDGKARRTSVAVDRVNPLAVGGVVTTGGTRAFRYDSSQAYPGIRWEMFLPEIELHLKNTLAFVACQTAAGVKTAAICRGEKLEPEKMTAPWLLLWSGAAGDAPLLLVFDAVPKAIGVLQSGRGAGGLRLLSENGGVLVPTWIYGSRPVDTSGWERELPTETLTRIAEWYPRAFCYPVRCRESFRLDAAKRRVRIRDEFEFLETKNSFGVSSEPYAVVPPVAAALGARGPEWFEAESTVRPTSLVTRFGPLLLAKNSERAEWTLRVPRQTLATLPHASGFERYDRLFNEQFGIAVGYTRGGHVRVDWAKDRTDRFRLWMHSSLLGMNVCLANPYGYSEENRRLLRRRLTWRLVEPLEDAAYRMATRYRREPFSSRRYTIYMNSPRNIPTVYEPEDFGTKIIYGDSNETVRMIFSALQKLADQFGQTDLVRANWETLSREVVSYIYAIDSWNYLCSGCVEWGGPGTIDMLNSEVGCMMEYARLAQIAGDETEEAQALYRAARRACPTLARFLMQDYYADNGLADRPLGLCLGFKEEQGAVFRGVDRAKANSCEFFDMSQGIPNALLSLYEDWGWEKLRREYAPALARADLRSGLNNALLAVMGILGGNDDLTLRQKLDEVVANEERDRRRWEDWGGITACGWAEYVFHRLTGSPVVTDCRSIDLHDAQYDCQTETLTLDFTPVTADAVLAVNGRRLDGLVPQRHERRRLHIPSGRLKLTPAAPAAEALKHRLKAKSKAFEDKFHPTYPSVCDVTKTSARPVPDFLRTAVMYQLFTRMFTPEGTFAAATKKLSELKDLGVDIIYLTPHQLADDDPDPVHWSGRQKTSKLGNPKNPYRQKDFYAVDPEYGTAEDLKSFVREAHRLGLRVMFDLVYFHCGPQAVFLKEHPEFIVRKDDGTPKLGDWAFPEMDIAKREVRDYLQANMEFLLREYDVDGFRCDVADMLPVDFWEEGYLRCRALKQDVFMMCEGLKGDDQVLAFDLSYGFYTQWTMVAFLEGKAPATMLETAWRAQARDYPAGFHWMRCFENHDFANVKPGERRKEALYGSELNAALIATCFLLDGVPMLYNGQEIADAAPHSIFSNRDHGGMCIDWSRAKEETARTRRALVRRLTKLRHENPALFDAPVVWNKTEDPEHVYSFTRTLPDGKSLTLAVDIRRKTFELN